MVKNRPSVCPGASRGAPSSPLTAEIGTIRVSLEERRRPDQPHGQAAPSRHLDPNFLNDHSNLYPHPELISVQHSETTSLSLPPPHKAVLILYIPDLSSTALASISVPIAEATRRVSEADDDTGGTDGRLLVLLVSHAFDHGSGGGDNAINVGSQDGEDANKSEGILGNKIESGDWDSVQKLLTHAYVQATTVAQQYDKILLCVDVLLRGIHELDGQDHGWTWEGLGNDWDVVFHQGADTIPDVWSTLPAVYIPGDDGKARHTLKSNLGEPAWNRHRTTALGGTFDHLHAGHKILLSMAAWITSSRIIVGVTDDTLLVKKANKEYLDSLSVRVESVRAFLALFKPGLVYDVVPIADVYGPTGWDPDIQALAVSKETLPGAAAIASLRTQKSLSSLRTYVIDVISAVSTDLGTEDPEVLKSAKMSSTYVRSWLARR